MFGLMTNVMLAVTTALAAIGASFAGNADVAHEMVEPPNVDLGGTWDVDVTGEHEGATSGGAHVGDGGANAYTDTTTEHASGSGAADVTGLDVPELPSI